jgi:hypothetical protein
MWEARSDDNVMLFKRILLAVEKYYWPRPVCCEWVAGTNLSSRLAVIDAGFT